jgi:MFS family permease
MEYVDGIYTLIIPDYNPDEAAKLASIIYVMSLVLSLLVGWSLDCFGKRPQMLLFGSVIMIPAFICLVLTNSVPMLWMCRC